MPDTTTTRPSIAPHGAAQLPRVVLDSYNEELADDDGFLGDRASRRAFRAIVERWRKPLRDLGEDPFGDAPSDKLSKKALDDQLAAGDPEAAGIVHSAIEEFAQELAAVTRRFLAVKAWRDTERIVVGGGFRNSRVGELAIGRAAVLLKAEKIKIDFDMIRHDPDEAGLVGVAHLAPTWIFEGHDALLAVDIGGTNIRAGVVKPNLKKANDLSKAAVDRFELWRHGDEKPGRTEAVDRLIDMLKRLIDRADKDGLRLAPFVGIGCPGMIEADGSIDRGARNLPGKWESPRFNLAAALHKAIPKIGDHETAILMHNDAVVQGLSQTPFMQDVDRWGVFTVGTGLGNARFTNREGD
ncbi:ROK family protein [Rhodoplanes azumiensis]|uniref:ROK family protein n=1 Tax=Rhodoplanes azumiensis TaxID=1897628 RepID=A0ABW5AII2_9BRAD